MNRKFSFSLFTALLLVTSTALMADSSKNAKAEVDAYMTNEAYMAKVKSGEFQKEATQEEAKRLNKVLNSAVMAHKNRLKKAPKEFMQGLNDTVMALQALKSTKPKEAKKLLQKAEKEFDTAFNKEPKLGRIPVMDNAEIITFNGSAKLIAHIKNSAVKLLQKNDTQLAIDMLMPLQDEMIIKTQYVPSYLYPEAVKKAQKELEKQNVQKAITTIVTVLNATEIDTVIIPIPLITAEALVTEASKIEKSHKQDALKLVDMAQEELQKALLLGYAHEYNSAYKSLQKDIKALKNEIKGKNEVEKLYSKLLQKFSSLISKHQKDVKKSK